MTSSTAPRSRVSDGVKQLMEPGDEPLFHAPDRESVYRKTIFKPLYDPLDVVETLFNVKTKGALIVPFRPFRTQRLFVKQMELKNAVVKPRQVGLSTINLALETANSITVPNINTLVVTHRDDTTATMRATVQAFIAWLNEFHDMGLVIGKDNENEMEIKTTGAWFFFQTAGGKGGGRSRTIHQLHASELAHWQAADPGAEYGAMTESVPDNGLIVAESTPNGAEGTFYDIYNNDPGYRKHFFPWFMEPSRRLPLNGHQLDLTDDEQLLVSIYNLHHEQIAWRRAKMAQLKAVKLDFAQEYPEDDITCWTAGTMPFFPGPRMNVYMRTAQSVPKQVETEGWQGDTWDGGGELHIWEAPRDQYHYVIGGDVGGGHTDGDQSVAVVVCRETGKHCATLAGWWKPQMFADLCIRLAERYRHAYLGLEANGIGQGAVDQAAYTRTYDNMHWEKRVRTTRAGEIEEWVPGFYIMPGQRQILMNLVLDQVVNGTFSSYDFGLCRQMTAARLIRGKVGGGWADRVEFPKSVHDDYVFAYAQALALRMVAPLTSEERPRPGRAY